MYILVTVLTELSKLSFFYLCEEQNKLMKQS